MRVKEIMAKDLKYAVPGMSLVDVARLMKECDCGAIPVVKSEMDKRPIGIITDRDITIRAVAEHKKPAKIKVEECMTASVATVREYTTLEECAALMEKKKVRRVPVVDDKGACIGIVSQAQIALHVPSKMAGELLQDISR